MIVIGEKTEARDAVPTSQEALFDLNPKSQIQIARVHKDIRIAQPWECFDTNLSWLVLKVCIDYYVRVLGY